MNNLSRILTLASVAGALLIGAARLVAEDPAPASATGKIANVQPVTTSPEVDTLKARIAWLEQKLAATEAKMTALMQFYGAQDQLTNLAKQEPKVEAAKK